jgi:hypothetical protein
MSEVVAIMTGAARGDDVVEANGSG